VGTENKNLTFTSCSIFELNIKDIMFFRRYSLT
jgi:hypothetical protein